jgi:cytochrome c oxidase cbb3-type subunit IV
MYKDFIKQEAGVDFYALFTLVLFTAFFAGLLIYAFTMRKKLVDEMSVMPLELDDDTDNNNLPLANIKNQSSSL